MNILNDSFWIFWPENVTNFAKDNLVPRQLYHGHCHIWFDGGE
ncbi:MAG: hypothetical protein R3C11_24655 [Planctomycetaceae bacterium]